MKIKVAHLLFEQSGAFKAGFGAFNIPAIDYDLENRFDKTDWQGDLFHEIKQAYLGGVSIFDNIDEEDLIIAFFPCTYFNTMNGLYFHGNHISMKDMSMAQKLDIIMERNQKRSQFLDILLMLFAVCERRKLRLIVENPYHDNYLLRTLPYKPSFVDKDRTAFGDSFVKPTMYYFVNCEPYFLYPDLVPKDSTNKVCDLSGIARSVISPDYAYNFIYYILHVS